MATTIISNTLARKIVDAAAAAVDAGSGANGKLVIYSGSVPAQCDTALGAQVALVTFNLPKPAYGAAAEVGDSAVATANAISVATAAAGGTATFYRIFDTDGKAVIQGDVTDTNGTGSLKISTTAIVQGIDVTVVSLTLTKTES